MSLWTCIAKCRTCGRELNRAVHVPDEDRTSVALSAPLVATCPEKSHNTLSDCNIGVELEWLEEKEDGQVG